MAKTVTITLTGDDPSDIEFALEQVQTKILEGYSSGFDENDTGSFSFESEGEWEYSEDED